MKFSERIFEHTRHTIPPSTEGEPSVSLDDLFLGLKNCKRVDVASEMRPDPATVTAAHRLARQAFRLNDFLRPDIAVLVEATALRLSRTLTAGADHSAELESRPVEQESPAQVDLDALVDLFGPTEAYLRVMEAMNAPVSSAARVAEAMADSPGLAGFALRLVNGPAYGLSARVATLSRAVAMAGFNEISGLSLAVHMARSLGSGDEAYWSRAMTLGLFARRLARQAGLTGDWFFAAGLLANIGELAARRELPQAYARACALARRSLLSRHEAQEIVLGHPLSAVSERLIRSWGGADRLAEVVGMRENPARAEYEATVCVLHVAEIMTQASFVEGGGGMAVSRLDAQALDALHLGPKALDIAQASVLAQARGLAESFAG